MAAHAELISPELVLVDPELASRVRSTWTRPPVVLPRIPAAAAPRPSRARSAFRRLGRGVLALALALGVFALATLLDDATSVRSSPPPTVRAAAMTIPAYFGPPALNTRRQTLTTRVNELLTYLGQIPALRRLVTGPDSGTAPSDISTSCELPSANGSSKLLLLCRASGPSSNVQLEVAVRCTAGDGHDPVPCVAAVQHQKPAESSTPVQEDTPAPASTHVAKPASIRQALATSAERQILAQLGRVPALRRLFTEAGTGLPLSHVSTHCAASAGKLPGLLRCRVWRTTSSGAASRQRQLVVAVRCTTGAAEKRMRCVVQA